MPLGLLRMINHSYRGQSGRDKACAYRRATVGDELLVAFTGWGLTSFVTLIGQWEADLPSVY